jgi:uncharacterized zinc-type alcohol dehydrogenase-like protein
MIPTYNGTYWPDEYEGKGDRPTYGGYSKFIVCREDFTLKIDKRIPLDQAAPLLCAGITMFSPLMNHKVQPHHKVAIAGLGGLGHMGVKIARAMGCHVTVISRNNSKKDHAIKELGASAYLDLSNAEETMAHSGAFDFMIDTIAAKHDLN